MHAFSLDQEDFWPGSRAIAVDGELDLAVVDRLRDLLDRAGLEEMNVLLDFSGCSFIDAGGLAVLVSAEEKLRKRGLRLLLYGVQGQVLRLLSLTGLTEDGLVIAGSEEEAKRSLGPDAQPPRRPLVRSDDRFADHRFALVRQNLVEVGTVPRASESARAGATTKSSSTPPPRYPGTAPTS